MDLNRPLTDRHEMYTQIWCGLKAKTYFSPPLKIWQRKTSNLPQIMEARNFEMAQHIDKQIKDVSSIMNTL